MLVRKRLACRVVGSIETSSQTVKPRMHQSTSYSGARLAPLYMLFTLPETTETKLLSDLCCCGGGWSACLRFCMSLFSFANHSLPYVSLSRPLSVRPTVRLYNAAQKKTIPPEPLLPLPLPRPFGHVESRPSFGCVLIRAPPSNCILVLAAETLSLPRTSTSL